ncbi:putative transcriptional regulator [Thermobacillus composti KWC4]|uniref:Putative transcriptional regulator n=1 Tax=Thermobacillus composti (strain DSM 18247 / JCM 13945 / KWC4) TaxID=717605 RepID=L0EII2_THECK|nr:MerR family transcriptional regulator [Thermobacillus composti]AGA58955.1 putative transcriptional regulator [Thermobacillus composti KWC4]
MSERGWTIGKLAKRAGLTVRALHHYDRIGLLTPSQYTEGGHRLYSLDDLVKLQQIVSLKELGFRLKEIKAILDDPGYDPAEMLELQLSRLDEQIRTLVGLRDKLRALRGHFRAGKKAAGEQFLTVMRMMNMARSPHFTAGQIHDLSERYLAAGHDEDKQAEIRRMLDEFRSCRDTGKTPDDPGVLALARRWKEVMDALDLASPGLVRSAERYYKENPEDGLIYGLDRELYLFIKKSLSRVVTDSSSGLS